MSAYCTTTAGIYLTTQKWGWNELGYKSTEYIINLTPDKVFTKDILNSII